MPVKKNFDFILTLYTKRGYIVFKRSFFAIRIVVSRLVVKLWTPHFKPPRGLIHMKMNTTRSEGSEKALRKASIFLLAFAWTFVSQAEESSGVSVYREGEMPGETLSEKASTKVGHISLRGGVHDWKDADLVDSSYGLQMELQFALGDTPLDIVLRGFYQDTSYEDSYLTERESGPYYETWVTSATITEIWNHESTAYGGSLQLLWNFDRKGVVNPYIAIGSMYEKAENTAYHPRRKGRVSSIRGFVNPKDEWLGLG